jgi:hypothetical protein
MVITIVVFLLLGAAINVAVAWGCALWSPCEFTESMSPVAQAPAGLIPYLPSDWPAQSSSGSVVVSQLLQRAYGRGLSVERLIVSIEDLRFDFSLWFDRALVVYRAGWPAPALECDAVVGIDSPFPSGDTDVPWRDGRQPPQLIRPCRWPSLVGKWANPIPLRPIWWGFLLNTLLYGAVCSTLLGGLFTVRRWRRVRRGLCLKCGYPVRGLKKCPECGKGTGGSATTGIAVEEKAGAP